MRIFPVDHKFVSAVACLALASASLPGHAIDFGDVVAGCATFFSPYKAFRGDDADLVGKWIVLSDRNPKIGQVVGVVPDALTVNWINFDTMLIETLALPRPKTIHLANDKAHATYRQDLEAASVRQRQRDALLIDRVVDLSHPFGPSRIISATPTQLEIEYILPHVLTPKIAKIGRPASLNLLTDVNYAEVVANARRLESLLAIRTGNYVYWAPNASLTFDGSFINLHYARTVQIPFRTGLYHELRNRGLVHARVAEVDLVKGTILLTSSSWSVTLPIQPGILIKSNFLPSPVGALDELPRKGTLRFTGFRQFRDAFLFGELKPGMAVLAFPDVGPNALLKPEEKIASMEHYRIVEVGPDFVIVSKDGQKYKYTGVANLARFSLYCSLLRMNAEELVAREEFESAFTAFTQTRRTNGFTADDLKRMPYLKELATIKRELGARAFDADLIQFYALQFRTNDDLRFKMPGQLAQDEYRRIQIGLHESKLGGLSPVTKAFVAELYSRATIAGRKLRGYSERR